MFILQTMALNYQLVSSKVGDLEIWPDLVLGCPGNAGEHEVYGVYGSSGKKILFQQSFRGSTSVLEKPFRQLVTFRSSWFLVLDLTA